MLELDIKEFEEYQEEKKNLARKQEEILEKKVQLRLNKEHEIKKLQIQANALRAEKSKIEETIALSNKYKQFLHNLSPK